MNVSVQRSGIAIAVLAALALLLYALSTLLGTDGVGVSTTTAPDASPATSAETAASVVTAEKTSVEETATAAAVEAAPEQSVQSASLLAASPFTGDAEVDLPEGDAGVIVIPDLAAGVLQPDLQPPIPEVTSIHGIGWDIKDLRVKYVPETDELIVALNGYGVVGDAEGNGNGGTFDPLWETANLEGTDVPDIGIGEAVSIGLDLDGDGLFDVIMGTHIENTIGDFAIYPFFQPGVFAPLTPTAYGFLPGFPTPTPAGSLAVPPGSPTLAAPDLVFSIADFSALPGNDDSLDFGINARAGSVVDGNIGEDSLSGSFANPVVVDLDATLGNFVWSDANANGIQDQGEPGIAGIDIELFDLDNNLIADTTTNDDGEYGFDVPPGTYEVAFLIPAGDTISPQFQGTDETIDSNADPVTGRAPFVALGPGEENVSIDAGIVEFVPAPGIDIEKATNGEDADTPTGPRILVGETARFTYSVTNTGNVTLANVTVTDDKVAVVNCPTDELVVNGSMTCWAEAEVVAGPYQNIGSVIGTPVDAGDNAQPVTDSDPSNHFGAVASIDIEKATNGEDADTETGPELIAGEDATFTYVVTNTGNVELVDIVVTDDVLGEVCTVAALAADASVSCDLTAVVTEGQYVNLGSVRGVVGFTTGDRDPLVVTDEDPSHHIGLPAGPECITERSGPVMYQGGTVRDETGLIAKAGSTIIIVTSEPGTSPDQPFQQVYVQVGDDLYGPTPIELGELEFTVEKEGLVTILHHSEVNGITPSANSVEYEWCGSELSRPPVHACDAPLSGPRMYRGSTVEWKTGLDAAPGSTISLTTSEPGASPGQPHEQVYLQVGDELFDATPNGHGTTTYSVTDGGLVTVHHYSVFNEDATDPNSVEVELCGTELFVAE